MSSKNQLSKLIWLVHLGGKQLLKYLFVYPYRWVIYFSLFLKDFIRYRLSDRNENFQAGLEYLYPCLYDKSKTTLVDPIYFYQDAWFAKKIFKIQPRRHFDIGSSVKTMSLIAQFIPVTFVDIRPVELNLENFNFVRGSILDLPFADSSLESLSSLCVVEHIGLGRYGDALDPFGSEKAIKELFRVLAPDGILYLSVPVDAVNKVYFNAHRVFTRSYIMQLLQAFSLLEEKYQYGKELVNDYDVNKGFGTGLFLLRKRRNTEIG